MVTHLKLLQHLELKTVCCIWCHLPSVANMCTIQQSFIDFLKTVDLPKVREDEHCITAVTAFAKNAVSIVHVSFMHASPCGPVLCMFLSCVRCLTSMILWVPPSRGAKTYPRKAAQLSWCGQSTRLMNISGRRLQAAWPIAPAARTPHQKIRCQISFAQLGMRTSRYISMLQKGLRSIIIVFVHSWLLCILSLIAEIKFGALALMPFPLQRSHRRSCQCGGQGRSYIRVHLLLLPLPVLLDGTGQEERY